jgi:Flp pilus assembly protein TadB
MDGRGKYWSGAGRLLSLVLAACFVVIVVLSLAGVISFRVAVVLAIAALAIRIVANMYSQRSVKGLR